ncbi:MAG: hypothetical protein B7Y39_10390 [Bdellovibrio sp. 28-41-41]|nr:MAG: hypothetical protein B7Y39_10390 [Bdellovibrio sp. 28-41-41]
MISVKAIVILVLFSSLSWSQYLDMNDVTILMPVPQPGEENLLIKPTDVTRSGELLFPAQNLFVGFELDIGSRRPMIHQTDDFRVIGIRLDHFQRQLYINLVWQKPVNGGIYTQASIHSGHTILDLPIFLSKMEELNHRLRRTNSRGSLPLQVNPTIAAEGFSGRYYQELKKIIMGHISPAFRVTFRSSRHSDGANGFAGWELPINLNQPSVNQFEVIPEYQPIQEPFRNWETYIPYTYLEIKNKLFSNVVTVGGLPPYTTKNFQPLIEDGSRAVTLPERELLEMIGRVYMVENPRIIPGIVQTECMSCHFAQPVRNMTLKLRPGLPYEKFAERMVFTSARYNLQNLSPVPRSNFTMAMGYVENTALWSQRLINETADTLEMLYGNRGALSSVRVRGSH